MPKVIVERPRHGHARRGPGKGYRRRQQRVALDEQPRRERLRQCGPGERKSFSERLGPLVRFLHNRVGRPWNAVEAEICAHLRRDNVIQEHVRDHLKEMVVTHVRLEKGRPIHAAGWAIGQPVQARWRWFHVFYVCPRSGLLKRSPRPKRTPHVHPPLISGWLRQPVRLILNGFNEYWVLFNGVWNLAVFEPFPRRAGPADVMAPEEYDALHQAKITRAQARERYGRAIVVKEVRPATRREVARYCT